MANSIVVDWSGSCTAGACAADLTPPAVKALAAVGAVGTLVALRYSLFDDSTKASETITVTRNGAAVWRKAQPLHGATVASGTFGMAWKVPTKPGAGVWRFTVEARDAAGNAARSSAAIRLRRSSVPNCSTSPLPMTTRPGMRPATISGSGRSR